MKLEIRELHVPLREPWEFAGGTITSRSLLLIELRDEEGTVGYGEAAPLEPYDGVSLADVRSALEDCRPVLGGGDGSPHPDLLARCAEAAVLPQAVAAIDLALWDLAARRRGRAVWSLLGAASPPRVAVNGTITAPDRAGAAARAAELHAAGFTCLKVKVGLGDDAGRVAAVRAVVGRDTALRLDANGAWTVDEARAALRVLAPAGIELCEEPVSGLDAMAELAATLEAPVPLALDESAALPGALERRVCDAVCLKLSRCGGISGLIDAARRARAVGYEVYLASTLDGPLGIAAALHAAAVIGPDRPCGLATLGVFEGRPDPLPAQAGVLLAPSAPGVAGDEGTRWYLAAG